MGEVFPLHKGFSQRKLLFMEGAPGYSQDVTSCVSHVVLSLSHLICENNLEPNIKDRLSVLLCLVLISSCMTQN